MPNNKYSENLDKAYDARKERRKNQRKLYNKFNKKELKSKELLRKYGIDADQYDRMVENQNNKCKILFQIEIKNHKSLRKVNKSYNHGYL